MGKDDNRRTFKMKRKKAQAKKKLRDVAKRLGLGPKTAPKSVSL